MEYLPKKITKKLEERLDTDSLRTLGTYTFAVDFATNDYLGIVHNNLLQETTTHHQGATGSRLLTGNNLQYNQLERLLERVHKVEGALVFNSGYTANLGLLGSVPQKGDLILYDQFVHASIRDGITLSQAKAFKFDHNNITHLKTLIERHAKKFDTVYVVTESVFSMDGDSPDLEAFCDLCDNTDSYLIVDEAHAVGIFGTHGQGLVQALGLERRVFARIVTFGKALGSHGAVVLGSSGLKQYLINFARSLIYTTAMPPVQLERLIQVYNWLKSDTLYKVSQKQLLTNIALLQSSLLKYNISNNMVTSNSAIHCMVIPGNSRVKHISSELQKLGFGVLPILAPTVPLGKERIRICLHAHNTEQQIDSLIKSLAGLIKQ